MKKAISVAALASMLIMSSTPVYAGEANVARTVQAVIPTVVINGQAIKFDHAPFIRDGVTLVPGRALLERLSFAVSWDEEKGLLSGSKQGVAVAFMADQDIATVNHVAKKLPLSARMVQGELFIPLRFVAEIDEREVKWESLSRTVSVTAKELRRINVSIPIDGQSMDEAMKVKLEKLSKQMEKDYKLQLDFELIPRTHYQEKLNVMIAAGQKLDLAYMPDPAVYPSNLVESIAWELDDFISSYPQLSQLPQQSLDQLQAINNGLYGIPKLTSSVDGSFPVVNQSWLDNLGFAEPKTMDELYAAMQGFTQHDPDANGKKDTYGLTGYIRTVDLGSLAWVEHVFNENVSRFEEQNGEIVDLAVGQGTREALQWLKKAYAEGLIDPEFAINTQEKAQQSFADGKSGLAAMTLSKAVEADQSHMQGKTTPLVSLKYDDEAAAVTGTSLAYDGMYFISKFATKEGASSSLEVVNELHSIANDAGADADVRALAIEIVGSAKINFDEAAAQVKERYGLVETARSELESKELLDISLYAKLENDLRAAKTELDLKMTEMKVKVIMGILPIEEWDSYIAKLVKDDNYIAMMNTFNNR